jgi:hypothetical protein
VQTNSSWSRSDRNRFAAGGSLDDISQSGCLLAQGLDGTPILLLAAQHDLVRPCPVSPIEYPRIFFRLLATQVQFIERLGKHTLLLLIHLQVFSKRVDVGNDFLQSRWATSWVLLYQPFEYKAKRRTDATRPANASASPAAGLASPTPIHGLFAGSVWLINRTVGSRAKAVVVRM